MFTLKGRDRPADPKDTGKPALKPALYDPPGSVGRVSASGGARPPAPSHNAGAPREGLPPAPAFPPRDDAQHVAPAAAPAPPAAPAQAVGESPGSKLFVGVNIKLKGVEITDCDVLT